MKETVEAWHFLRSDCRLLYGSQEKVSVGRVFECEGVPKLCYNGMHGSRYLTDAIRYAPGPILCKVKIWGSLQEDETKVVGAFRKVLSMTDVSKALHLYALEVAKMSFGNRENTELLDLLEVKRQWVEGTASDEELDTERKRIITSISRDSISVLRATSKSAIWSAKPAFAEGYLPREEQEKVAKSFLC